jgi:glycine oxidase
VIPESLPRGGRAAVIGGGIIGLSIARRLHADGWAVTVFERARAGKEASSAAGGMIAPRFEFAPGSPLLEMGLASRALYPGFVRGLEEETGLLADLRLDGFITPLLAGEEEQPLPEEATLVAGPDLRALEPALDPGFSAGLLFAGDGSVDNRALVAALLASCRRRGVRVLEGAAVEEVLVERGRVTGVRTPEGRTGTEIAVNCAGAWAGELRVPGAVPAIRPVKGQMLALDAGKQAGAGPRHTVARGRAYVVPRSDGRVVVGTTVEEKGFDKTVDAQAIAKLIEGAVGLCPSLGSARFVEAWAGLRPLGPEETPRIGPAGPDGYFLAVGHYRNGILLAPWTADRIADAAAGRPPASIKPSRAASP